ncbi:hypothetical protein B0O99DRAFT_514685 [Bisporella sp. PMI_857]|nr:hypothetical protein B0O99DRAFT_514685 [Bisporella sp. PMI_857]
MAKDEQVATTVAEIKPTPTKQVPAKATGSSWPENPFDPVPEGSNRPLILFAFFETPAALLNFKFFLAHALHGNADFLFIIQGDSKEDRLIPKKPNIRVHRRPNKCYDLGAFAEVLVGNDFYKGYQRYILINASIRGPFMPHWADGCWSDMYLNKLTDEVKLVGMSMSCDPVMHVQSMIWALDRVGLETLIWPNAWTIENFRAISWPADHELDPTLPIPYLATPGIHSCPSQYWEAVSIEIHAALLIMAAGYKFDVMMEAYSAKKIHEGWEEECHKNSDMLQGGHYYGGNVNAFELLFMKTNRHSEALDEELDRLTSWVDELGYSSWDHCKA